ncbi:MAG: hypothetical protein RR922_03310 [Clostridia bacterium]
MGNLRIKKSDNTANILLIISSIFILFSYLIFINVNNQSFGILPAIFISCLPVILVIISCVRYIFKREEKVKYFLIFCSGAAVFLSSMYLRNRLGITEIRFELYVILAMLTAIPITHITRSIIPIWIAQIGTIAILSLYAAGDTSLYVIFALIYLIFSIAISLYMLGKNIEKQSNKMLIQKAKHVSKKVDEKEKRQRAIKQIDGVNKSVFYMIISILIMLAVAALASVVNNVLKANFSISILNEATYLMLITLALIYTKKKNIELFKVFEPMFKLAICIVICIISIDAFAFVEDSSIYLNYMFCIILNIFLLAYIVYRALKKKDDFEISLLLFVVNIMPCMLLIGTRYLSCIICLILGIYLLLSASNKSSVAGHCVCLIYLCIFIYATVIQTDNMLTNIDACIYMFFAFVSYVLSRLIMKTKKEIE